MSRSASDLDAQLEASVRRIRGALEQNRSQYAPLAERVAAIAPEVAERVAATGIEVADRVTARIAERHRRRMERWRRREERRAAGPAYDFADLPRGIVRAVAAIVCLVLAVRHPALWWLIFVAFGWGMSAAASFGRAARRPRVAQREGQAQGQEQPVGTEHQQRTETSGAAKAARVATVPPPAPAVPPDPRVVRIQTLCDKLLAELESGPPVVREVVTKPQETIGGLRQACLEIARREHELRDVLGAQDEAGLVAEREALAARLSNEQDEIVRDRLGQALRALEQQLEHRAELATAAMRLEAENTRILYTLENLHMQLLRARSTDIGAPELGGKLRESLQEIGAEIDGVAEALEIASTPGGGVRDAAPPVATSTKPAPADTESAERLAAARRAAQAREAQRR